MIYALNLRKVMTVRGKVPTRTCTKTSCFVNSVSGHRSHCRMMDSWLALELWHATVMWNRWEFSVISMVGNFRNCVVLRSQWPVFVVEGNYEAQTRIRRPSPLSRLQTPWYRRQISLIHLSPACIISDIFNPKRSTMQHEMLEGWFLHCDYSKCVIKDLHQRPGLLWTT